MTMASGFDIGYSMGYSAGMSSSYRRRGLSLPWVLALAFVAGGMGYRRGMQAARWDCPGSLAARISYLQEVSTVTDSPDLEQTAGVAVLVGFALLYARARADSEPARRSYRLGPDRFTYNRPDCDHADQEIDEIDGVVYCLDCGQPLAGVA